MTPPRPTIRIGIYGPDVPTNEKHGCGLWQAGVAASIAVAEGESVLLPEETEVSWGEVLENIYGVVVFGHDKNPRRHVLEAEAMVSWCHDHTVPVLAIDHGLHIMNTAHGGTIY